MRISRDFYLNQLKIREKNGMIKVITGIRRCGKSYLLFDLFYSYLINNKKINQNNIIKIALDSIENDHLREPHKLYEYIKDLILNNNDTYYILLDEIQFVNRFSEVLNSLLRLENTDIYVTGSNSKFLSSDILTEFRGRGDEIRIYPLSFSEFYKYYDSYEEAFYEYITYGGLPKILSFKTEEQKIKYLINLFNETYLKDIKEHNNIKNTDELDDLINIISSQIGSLINPRKLENTFNSVKGSKITDKTIKKYLEYLMDAFIINIAIRYDIKGKKYINTPFKIYFEDLGLRNARLGFRQIEETHLMENMIYNDLIRRGYNVDVGVVDIRILNNNSKCERKSLEVDFIANKGNKKYYIQSAYSLISEDKKMQEVRPFLNIDDSFKKIIIVKDFVKLRRDDNGIVTMCLKDFLLDDDSLDY